MTNPLVRELADDGIPVTVTCRVLGFSPQGYYRWRARPCSTRDLANAYLTNALVDAHADDPPFGYRFLADELERQGQAVSERRVWRLCSDQGLFSSFTRQGRAGKRPGPPVHDDLVRREFSAGAMNQLWFTDITEHPTAEGKLYLVSIEDAFSGRIVGYSMGERMTSDLAVSALRNAIALREPAGTIVHADRGSQTGLNRLHPHIEEQRAGRLDGPAGGRRRQRGHGVVPRPAPEERARLTALADPRGAEARDRHLGRAHLPPAPAQAPARQDDPGRVRSRGSGP
jgi:putative transposase